MALEADIFFSRLSGIGFGVPSRTFLALSQLQVKPEMGMPALRRKPVVHRRRDSSFVAAQHNVPAAQH
jgi:hypothetical protein